MINSLSKDSHITQSLLHSQISSGSSANNRSRQEYSTATVNNNIGTSINKPTDKVSFRGLSNVKLANSDSLRILNEKAKQYLGQSANPQSIKELISGAVKFVRKPENDVTQKTKGFLENAKQDIILFIKKAEELVTADNMKNPLKVNIFKSEVDTTMDSSIKGLAIIEENKKGFFTSNKYVKGFLKLAAESEPLFNATFSIGLACILRPASIMTLPGDKKNNDDKKYAAAHSIAAGVISYLIALAIFNPIADAVKNIIKNPKDYLGNSKLIGDNKALSTAGTYLKMIPETILAAPRAMITIALIPPILKYVFGWEKKKTQHKETQAPQNYQGGVR